MAHQKLAVHLPMFLRDVIHKIRRNKIFYYANYYLQLVVPSQFYKRALSGKLARLSKFDIADIRKRVDYYNKLNEFSSVRDLNSYLKDIQGIESNSAYRVDTIKYSRYFNPHFKANFLFGDVTIVADKPSIQKSRPIHGDNTNAVILKLDRKRHFFFLKDHKKFSEKKDMLIGRAYISQPHRMRFMEMYFNNPLCDLGQVNTNSGNLEWLKPRISIAAHLDYKFILSLEGNDVATNLKWIMSSNSIAVMPKPKYETWFMEGTLIPDFHYIQIKDDYSDLAERLQYYIDHPEEAQKIINNAQQYIKQFLNPEQEDLISLLVLQKYFYYTSQTNDYLLKDLL
ncbi:glycosyl transferase family 90 [Arcticibacter pallidicorallinus]|uniref:Glycosyl transferase family 90 n=1 Tax=Arcticibacter pallidicorallinus TaxID=1259464 RepID=A0A2T0U762_9SPHI|nr:glycosyltransferase family 90 protein [Arcticibacter pallidicorallinus]PRY53698.1 glycosyl transferase family 90 [Arcticibacter pallidicorallinus]